ncbi:succinate-semialdehyde dehydrogenase, mitochondrial-like [Ciona intestinalis]
MSYLCVLNKASQRLLTISKVTEQSLFAKHPGIFGKQISTIHDHATNDVLQQTYLDKAYINGEWLKVSKTFPVTNPYNGKIVGHAADCNKQHAQDAIEVARTAFGSWKETCSKERAKVLLRWHQLILSNSQSLAELITVENGKPITEALTEVAFGATFVEWLAEEAKRNYGTTIPTPHPNKRLMSIKQPIGVAGMITPWNSPNSMITRKACSAIAAGCTVVLKPSEETPFSALALAKLGEEAGLPPGVLNIIPTSRERTPEVGEVICTHPDVAAVSFTGSTATGKHLLKLSASTVKKVSLELGGLAPFIIFDSADIEKAVQGVIASKFRYMGQTCVCANRIFVQESVHDEFVSKLVAAMKEELILGDTMDPNVTIGPLINEKAVQKVESHVEDAVRLGAKVVYGGKRGPTSFFYEPTLLTDINKQMKCLNEETFGPVAPIMKFKSEEEVLDMANDTRFGLAGYFYSNDVAQCWRVAEKLEVGMVGINEGFVNTTEAPFGGVKESGLGREGSQFALDEFTEIKYMCWGV